MVCTGSKNYDEQLKDGVVTDRGCTDVFFILVLAAFCGGMAYIMEQSILLGNPRRLIYGVDSWGNACNSKNKKLPLNGIPDEVNGYDTTGLDKSFYFHYIPGLPTKVVCVSACPKNPVTSVDKLKELSEEGIHLCRYDVTDFDSAGSVEMARNMAAIAQESSKNGNGEVSQKDLLKDFGSTLGNVCPAVNVLQAYGSFKNIMNRCVPSVVYQTVKQGLDFLDDNLKSNCQSAGSAVEKMAADWIKVNEEVVKIMWATFGVAFFVTLVMSVVIAWIIKMLMICCVIGLIAVNFVIWFTWWENVQNEEYFNDWFYGASGISIASITLILIIIAMKNSINFVIQLFVEGAAAVFNLPLLLFTPLVTLTLQVITVAGFGFGYLYLFSAGFPVMKDGNVVYEQNDELFQMQWYYLFGVLWAVQFFSACQTLIIAGAISEWYFSRNKGIGFMPILKSIYRLVRYHLGTVLFGSFLIAIVQWVKAVLVYIERQLKAAGESEVARLVVKVLFCCFWCLENIIKFLTGSSYIMVSILGCNLCTGGVQAFRFIIANILKVGALNTLGAFTLFLTKLLIVGIMLAIGFFKFRTYDICFIWVPLIPIVLVSFFIAHVFVSVYGMTLDTLILCFCIDSEFNDGVERPFFMRKGLMRFLDKAVENYSRKIDGDVGAGEKAGAEKPAK